MRCFPWVSVGCSLENPNQKKAAVLMTQVKGGDRLIGVIPARMGSSRFFGKPLAKILGKEMIGWVYENVTSCSMLKEVYVATDGEEISEYCERQGIPCVMTSPDHKNCSERSNEVCRKVGGDLVVEIQGDEPTLEGETIDAFIRDSLKSDFDVAVAYAEISPDDAKSAHTVKVAMDHRSRALFFSRSPLPCNFKEKDGVRYYGQVGLYLWKASALERYAATEPSDIEAIEDTHMLRLVVDRFDALMVQVDYAPVGVDLPEDIHYAESYLKKRESS